MISFNLNIKPIETKIQKINFTKVFAGEDFVNLPKGVIMLTKKTIKRQIANRENPIIPNLIHLAHFVF